MNLRAKLYPAFVIACVAALALLCFAQYRRGVRAVDERLRADSTLRAAIFVRRLKAEVREHGDDLSKLAADAAWGEIYRSTSQAQSQQLPVLTDETRSRVTAFFAGQRGLCSALTLVAGNDARSLVRFQPPPEGKMAVPVELPPNRVELGGQNLATLGGQTRAALTRAGDLLLAAPVSVGDDVRAQSPVALVAEMKFDALATRAAGRLADGDGGVTRWALALDRTGRLLYHSDPAFHYQNVATVMPYFNAVTTEMETGRSGEKFFDDADGSRWLAAYAPVGDLDLHIAVASNETALTAELRRDGMIYLVLSLAFALAAAALVVTREVRATRRIERVARAARAVAEGDMDERLETSAYDRTRVIAESFNLMTERLRGLIRREAENRQFQAFIRLSAMLTHDLKNAITGLSILVTNMERQFHREEFRADAISSLREATDKLRALVARLSKPAETLSGEYRSALQPVDLVVVIRRVIESTAARSSFHEVEQRLPDTLEVVVDAERIERVIENLVINALEAMGSEPGKLTLTAGRENDEQVFVTVADTGAGMSKEFIHTKLFQPFATTKKQGLGLGLYTCREIVEAHGGRIKVESEQGSGTRFRIVLPSRPVSLRRDKKTV